MKKIITLLLTVFMISSNIFTLYAAPRSVFKVEDDEVKVTTAWKASVNVVSPYFAGVDESKAIDGEISSFWAGSSPRSGSVQYITIDMGESTEISGVRVYIPNFALYSSYHLIGSIYVSDDGSTWTFMGQYTNQYDAENPKLVVDMAFGANINTRFVKYQIDSLNDAGTSWGAACVAEIRMLKSVEIKQKMVRKTTRADVTPAEGKVTLKIGETKATVDGKETEVSVAPYIRNGATMVPLQFVAGALGGDYSILGETAKIRLGTKAAQIKADSYDVNVSGTILRIRHKTAVENGTFMIPVQILSDVFGLNVSWNQNEMSIVILK